MTATQTDASIITSADELDTALGQASEGDTVVVSDVTYTQELTIDKAITLAGYNFTVEAPVSVTADNAVIENVTVSVSGTTRAAGGAALTVNAAGVTLEGVVVDAGAGIQPVSVTSTEGFTMQGCTIGGNLSGTNAFVALNVNGAAVIEDNVLDGKADAEAGISYNALEFCVSNTAYSVGDGTVISGNTVRNFSNNGINIYCIQDGAVISVEGNVFENVSNAMRISNVSNNAKTATFNIANNRHNESNAADTVWAGFVMLQDAAALHGLHAQFQRQHRGRCGAHGYGGIRRDACVLCISGCRRADLHRKPADRQHELMQANVGGRRKMRPPFVSQKTGRQN